MERATLSDIRLGDVVRTRKPHPCGGDLWTVVRVGADIGVRCAACGRRVLMPRAKYVKAVKAVVRRQQEGSAPDIPVAGTGA